MAKKTVDPLKAKQARQKKIAIGGGVLLLAVMGFQVPRTMKMLKGPPASPSAAPAATTTAPATATPAPAPASATPAAVSEPETARIGVVDPAAPAPVTGQLVSFDRFESKDPFVQQLRDDAAPGSSRPPGSPQPGSVPSPGGPSIVPPSAGSLTGGSVKPPVATPTPGSTDPAAGAAKPPPTAAPPPATAVIAVNGVEETVALQGDFPKLEPVFRLAALTRRSAKIAIAGGSYATGAKTVTLVRGKPLTLMNTTDGTRYELRLLTVA